MDSASRDFYQDIGDQYQQQTKYHRDRIPVGRAGQMPPPELYKTYPDCEKTALPEFDFPEVHSVLEAAGQRRSVRHFRDTPMTPEHLSCLLWASSGISRRQHDYAFRTAPSAGALYPIETYVLVNRVQSMEPGMYHYHVQEHALEQLRKGPCGRELARAALGQRMCDRAAAVFVYAAVFERTRWKYGPRAIRYIYLDAGHIAGNLALTAVGLGLGTCQIGAFYDDECNEILGLDGRAESVIYMSVVGIPA